MKIPPKRWTICGLLFVATTLNYMDRQILGVLAPLLEKEIGWSELQYGMIVSSFQAAYALGFILSGRFIDLVGCKIGLGLAVLLWSFAAMAHAGARTIQHFACARFALGLAESGNFPASLKVVSQWFPERERALATGIFNAGTNMGAILTPLLVPWIAINWGWQSAFLSVGALGVLWLGLWYWLYPSGAADFQEAAQQREVPWLGLLRDRRVLGFAAAKFLSDPIWWFYLYWIPKYLNKEHGLSLTALGLPLIVIYLLADVGSILGGWGSSKLVQRGISVIKARYTVMGICALCVFPVMLVPQFPSLLVVVGLLGLAAAAHQGWSANLFTSVTDQFPQAQVASVVGIGGMCGALGGMLVASAVGLILEVTGSYQILFSMCGIMYCLALMVFKRRSNTI